MPTPSATRHAFVAAFAAPVFLLSLAACGQTDTSATASTSAKASVSQSATPSLSPTASATPSPTPSASPTAVETTAEPTPEVTAEVTTEAPSPEATAEPSPEVTTEPTPEATTDAPAPEPSPTPSVAKLEASAEEQRAIFASAEELAALNAANEQSLKSRGIDPNDEYVKYGEVLCQGEAFPTSDDLKSIGASEAFISWYAEYVAAAPAHVVEMSNGNRAVEEQGAAAPAIDTAKCKQYGLISG